VVQETGAYTGEIKVKYEEMANQLAAAGRKMINYVNTVVWQDGKIDPSGSRGFPAVVRNMLAERAKILNTPQFVELKKAIDNMSQ
jgi:hypothetical protein